MGSLITLLIIILVLVICGYLFIRYVLPVIPAPWGNIILAIVVVIIIIVLLQRFVL